MKPVLVGLAILALAGGAALYLYGVPRTEKSAETPPGAAPAPGPEEAPPASRAGGEDSLAKAFFMRRFVAALAAQPENLMPNPAYAPLLKEGATLRCADCHASKDFDTRFAAEPDVEPGPFRLDRADFMIPLMEKWVARLNKRHADKLVKEVTCGDCHGADPRDGLAAVARVAPLMDSFVRALTAPPKNLDPAKAWKPLLKAGEVVSCANCHGWELQWEGPRPPPGKSPFKIRLMERWVHELNVRMKDKLVHAVGCIDCHEVDPRK